MRILAAADIHGFWAVYTWLLAAVHEHHVDAMVLAGDLLGSPDGFKTPEEAHRHEAQLLAEFLDSAGVPILYIMGNDDLVELGSATKRVQSIHGRSAELGPFRFVGYQYSLPFMGGVFEKPEAEIQIDLVPLAPLLDANTVFVSHSPALGILDLGFGEARIGSSSIRKFLEVNPFRAHIHGHSHQGFGRESNHFNVASAGQLRAMLLDLETMSHQILARGTDPS
jgi:Icc-related predicted phosphoesterase